MKNAYLKKFLYTYKKQIFFSFLLGLISSAFLLVMPYFSKLFIDKAFINRSLDKFINLSIWGAGIFIFSTLVKAAGDILKNKMSIKLKLNLADKFIRKFYRLDFEFLQSRSVGESVFRFSDTDTSVNFILEQCPQILLDIVKLPIILGVCLWINTQMTLLLLILSPLFLLHSLYLQKKLKPIYEEIWKFSARLSKEVYEAFSRMLIIKVFGLESFQRRRYFKSFIENIRWGIRGFRWGIISSLTSSFLSKAVYGGVTLYGGWMIIKGDLTIGSYTAIMLYLTQLGGLLDSLSHRFEFFVKEMVSLNRFLEIIEIEPKIKDSPSAKALSSLRGRIIFEDVKFGYENGKIIFPCLNAAMPPASWIAIAGPSGCGKTTLVNLILRLYEPKEGKITLDGQDLKNIKLGSLREKISIATQEPFLFDVSIKENIAYGLNNITQGLIAEAARLASVEEFILQLPEQYDTLVGENAFRLSQGLKQRISIARAVLRNPDLLILDEATSSVDLLTEEKIYRALREKRKGLSTIVISHRLFSIKDADRIYFLSPEGKIAEGTHEELLSRDGLYKELFLSL